MEESSDGEVSGSSREEAPKMGESSVEELIRRLREEDPAQAADLADAVAVAIEKEMAERDLRSHEEGDSA